MDKIIKLDIPKGYEYFGIDLADGKLLLKKKSIEYPKTFEECCKTVNAINSGSPCVMAAYLGHSITCFAELIIMRDAYWAVYAENMGLDKPWTPDWTNTNENKYCIYCVANELKVQPRLEVQHPLTFPTRAICDAFFHDFRTRIESCKEFL